MLPHVQSLQVQTDAEFAVHMPVVVRIRPVGRLPEQRTLYTPADVWPDLPRLGSGQLDRQKIHDSIDVRLDANVEGMIAALQAGDTDRLWQLFSTAVEA
eukprot:14763754-Alexandrium_andersonii.AAC.1